MRRSVLAFYNSDIKDIFLKFSTSEKGLTSNQAELNRNQFGSNEPEKQKKESFFKKFLLQFKNIMIIILLVSAIISCAMSILEKDTENLFEGLLIFGIVIVNAIVGVIQEQKAENALLALQNKTIPHAKILRNNKMQKLKINEIVAGDIISLKAGDYIPADTRIISCKNLRCNESSLTGESQDVTKTDKLLKSKNLPTAAQENMCFAGTNVTSGKALGVVVAVGKNSEFGKIEKILNTQKKEKTPLEKNIDKIGKFLTFSILAIVAIVFLVQVLFNKNITIMQALLTSVALAVAAIPESLPAVITIIMALGVQKLAKQNAIVKKLSAVETLGCCNIICTDKTGTLTENKMSVNHIATASNIFDAENFPISENKLLFDICSVCNSINSNDEFTGDATETALINFLKQNKIDFMAIKQSYKKIDEREFNSLRKFMSVTVEQNNNKFLMVKGAIDYILPKCKTILIDGNQQPLTEKLLQKVLKQNEIVCNNGERVIAFASKSANLNNEETELCFVGFIGIIDPPRKEVKASIKQNKAAGIKTIMITGDHPTTAFAIAKELGIARKTNEVLSGKDLDNISKKDLEKIINNYSVFARVTPQHKLKIVEALKSQKNIVAMTGDGVNDAPSVKNANIGVCMGITGTDVTKEVADIIVSDDNYSTITTAVKQGRTIYQNISKTILFLLSTNIVEVLGIFVTSLIMHNCVFLLPTQILFINLVTDSLPAFALGLENPEKNIMNSPPRDSNKSILSGATGTSIIYQGFIQTLVVLVMFVFANNKFGNEVASTMSFLTICLMQIVHAINCKTESSIFKINIFKNKFFNFSFLFLLGLILAVYFIPPLAALFSLTTLSGFQWMLVGLTSVLIIPAVELGKLFIKE